MPELPEVETTRLGLLPHLKNHALQRVRIRQKSLRWPVPSSLRHLQQQRLVDIRRRAKYLLFDFEKDTMLMHLGMSGSLRLGNDDKPRKHDHLSFEFGGGLQMHYHDPRRFGCALPANSQRARALLQDLGPEPLERTFNARYLHRISRNSRRAIKTLLMDQRLVVGIGNIYASEVLFLASVHPARPAGEINEEESAQIACRCKQVLRRAISQGGSTLRDFVNPDGEPGYFAQNLWVYGRTGETCRRCQAPLQHQRINQRGSWHCPECQS